jgi:hypothetical protein
MPAFWHTDDVLEAHGSNAIPILGALFKKYQISRRAVQMQKLYPSAIYWSEFATFLPCSSSYDEIRQ